MEIRDIIERLKAKGFIVYFANTVTEAKNLLLEIIGKNDTVGFGGSATLDEIGIADALLERGNVVYSRRLMPDDEPKTVMDKALFADWFLSSTNAMTELGEFVNTDGTGNRVAAQIFGGANTVLVLGINKIVPTLPDAVNRINTEAAKRNCLRFGKLNNPCVTGGSCKDCPVENSICSVTTVIHKPTHYKNFHVVIVNKELGF